MSLPPIARPVSDGSGRVPATAARADDGTFGPGQRFDELLSGLKGSRREAGAFLGDQVREEGHTFRAPTAARMFNEHGFFHGAVGASVASAAEPTPHGASLLDDPAGAKSAVAPAAVPAIPHCGTPVGRDEMITVRPLEVQVNADGPVSSEPIARDAPFAGARTAAAVEFVGTPRPTVAGMHTIAQPAAARASPTTPKAALSPKQELSAAREERATSSAAPKRIAVLIERLLDQARATGIRVDVRIAEEGLKIVARTEKLGRAERGRLLAEIAALVARHGRGPARISLNGQIAPEQRPWRA